MIGLFAFILLLGFLGVAVLWFYFNTVLADDEEVIS